MKKYLYKILFTKKVKIVKISNPFCWYNKRIGEFFVVEKVKKQSWMFGKYWKTEYITVETINGHNRGYIKKSDVKHIKFWK